MVEHFCQYNSHSDNSDSESSDDEEVKLPQKKLAPEVDVTAMVVQSMNHEMSRFERETKIDSNQNHLTGFLQTQHIDRSKFMDQYHSFQSRGFAQNPTDGATALYIGDQKPQEEKSRKQKRRELKKKRQAQGEVTSSDFKGPWAIYEGMEQFKTQAADLSTEQQDIIKKFETQRKERLQEAAENDRGENEVHRATSIYHGNTQNMYSTASKSFIDAPGYLRQKEHDCFIPKKWLHTWSGHDKGVQRVRFFPKTGHLMLSASHDGTCKIWDVLTHRKCIRTYMGHQKAVKDICFTNDGRRFLSAGFDKVIQLWDTETGKVIRSFSNQRTPYCVKFHPADDKQNIFLAGCSNRKILQFDTNCKEIVQQYEEHLGSIDTLTFLENGKRFVSTSDDKKIFVWEFGIPVVAKHISEPDMHAVPATTMHPNGKYFAGQSMDNKIVIYDVKHGNFKLNRKKKFTGHINSGYACGLKFSPDGQFLASGDADGKLWFWNWKTCKNYRTMAVHEGSVTIDVDWHPIEPSKVVTCAWDGSIKLWD